MRWIASRDSIVREEAGMGLAARAESGRLATRGARRWASSLALASTGRARLRRAPRKAGPALPKRTVFPAFDPNAPACSAPPGLKPGAGLRAGERPRVPARRRPRPIHGREGSWLGVSTSSCRTTMSARRSSRLRLFSTAKVGALVATSPDPIALSKTLQQVDLVRRLCRHHCSATRNLDPQCSAVCAPARC